MIGCTSAVKKEDATKYDKEAYIISVSDIMKDHGYVKTDDKNLKIEVKDECEENDIYMYSKESFVGKKAIMKANPLHQC